MGAGGFGAMIDAELAAVAAKLTIEPNEKERSKLMKRELELKVLKGKAGLYGENKDHVGAI